SVVCLAVGLTASPAISAAPQPAADRSGQAAQRDESFGVKAVTRPSKDATMGFRFPTEILEVMVRDGSAVSAGQPLVRADDAEVTASHAIAKLRAESTLDIDIQRAALELAEVEFAATQRAFEGGGGSSIELDRSRLQRDTAVIQLEAAHQRDIEADNQLAQITARLEDHTLVAPFDGTVDAVLMDVGDSVRETDPVLRLVSVDPLLIDAATPTERTLGLRPGDPAWALVRIGEERWVLEATIVGVSPVADSVTGARRVRVEAANPDGLPAGLTAYVRFDEPGGAWAELVAPDGATGVSGTGG
ncbi:MAG: efflux RND transporter periplasmic adaptor subunit, partial [Phycisphaerales bacterium]